MRQYVWALSLLVLIALCSLSESRTIEKRQIRVDASLHPEQHGEIHVDESWRDKRKIEAKYGIKNALLGFVFNKINSWIDKKTHWVVQLDKTNIAKNKAYGIEPPKDPVVSLTHIITDKVGSTLQAAGPFLGVVVQKITSGSGGLLGGASTGGQATATHDTGHATASAGAGFNLGSIGSLIGSLSAGKGFGGGGGAHLSAGASYGR